MTHGFVKLFTLAAYLSKLDTSQSLIILPRRDFVTRDVSSNTGSNVCIHCALLSTRAGHAFSRSAFQEGRRHFSTAPHNFNYTGKTKQLWRDNSNHDRGYVQSVAHYVYEVIMSIVAMPSRHRKFGSHTMPTEQLIATGAQMKAGLGLLHPRVDVEQTIAESVTEKPRKKRAVFIESSEDEPEETPGPGPSTSRGQVDS